MKEMEPTEKGLFSLELVIEKLYIPHTACRFPAIAFRLLDFPTIVIKHVEDDLGKAIRRKISFDPSYQLPQQFIELKDKHGNFLIKKGKSCLFTMQPDILKQHLVSTPLYVMIIDLFPETPKLVGNSTVPLDSTMELICSDLVKLGCTVPSVHGDKGLFKLYNLMGKEIGYFVLGYRLLSLGPGMIQHLPESALLQRRSNKKQKLEEERVDNMVKGLEEEEDQSDESVVELRTSACMTDPIKQDAHLQTIELEDKAVHVEFSNQDAAVDVMTPTSVVTPQTKSTQTGRKKNPKKDKPKVSKWIEQEDLREEDDGPIITNIICPPPLFYNSEAAPAIEIERGKSTDDQSLELSSAGDLSNLESFDGYGLNKEKERREEPLEDENQFSNKENLYFSKYLNQNQYPKNKTNIPQVRPNEKVQGLNVAPQADAVFPLLTALIQELSCIQNPELLLGVSQKIQAAQSKQTLSSHAQAERQIKDDKISPSAVSAVAAALLTRKIDSSKDRIPKKDFPNTHNAAATKSEGLSKQEKDIKSKKELPSTPKKKKLVYGMTNTQRLRLEKANPSWLKNVEKEAAAVKPEKMPKTIKEKGDLTATNLSDTLTEVRRLAEIELNSTAGGDTLRQIASEVEERESTLERERLEKMKTYSKKEVPHSKVSASSPTNRVNRRATRHSPNFSQTRKNTNVSKSHSQVSEPSVSVSKSRSRMRHRRVVQKDSAQSSDSDELMAVKRPTPSVRRMKNVPSQQSLDLDEQRMNDVEEGLSARSDLPSSRSRSIEVRLPSAEPGYDDNATITDEESDRDREMDDEDRKGEEGSSKENLDDDDIPLPDDSMSEKPKVQVLNFPRYVSREISLPDSIEGVPNASLNVSGVVDENSPLESTRQSKNMTEDQNDSRILHSTEYDTRQFHSTDEPELQGLMSEEENPSDPVESGRQSVASVRTSQKFPVINPQMSQNSPVPSVRRSTTKLDTGGQSYLPSMSLSKGFNSPVSSRPSTPKASPSRKKKEFEPLIPNREGKRVRGSITPRSGSNSPKRPTPRSRRAAIDLKASIHTDSLSSYMPSDPENLVSLSSNSGNYSDDFVPLGSGESGDAASSVEQLPKLIPASKLAYTIN